MCGNFESDYGITEHSLETYPMPRHQICSIPGCSRRSDRPGFEGIKFHRLPQDPYEVLHWSSITLYSCAFIDI